MPLEVHDTLKTLIIFSNFLAAAALLVTLLYTLYLHPRPNERRYTVWTATVLLIGAVTSFLDWAVTGSLPHGLVSIITLVMGILYVRRLQQTA